MKTQLKLRKETIERLENVHRQMGGGPSDLNPCVTDSVWQERCPLSVECWESATPKKCPIISKPCPTESCNTCTQQPGPTLYEGCGTIQTGATGCSVACPINTINNCNSDYWCKIETVPINV